MQGNVATFLLVKMGLVGLGRHLRAIGSLNIQLKGWCIFGLCKKTLITALRSTYFPTFVGTPGNEDSQALFLTRWSSVLIKDLK